MNTRLLISTIVLATLVFAGCTTGAYPGGVSQNASDGGHGNAVKLGKIDSVVRAQPHDPKIQIAEAMEPKLNSAGFSSKRLNSSASDELAEGLAPLSFNRLVYRDKIRYWFPDPYHCRYVYSGSRLDLLRYRQAENEQSSQKNAEEALLVDSENQVYLPMNTQWNPVSGFWTPDERRK